MKFGFVVTNLAGGGAEKALLKLGALLTTRNHEVQLLLLEHRVEHAVPSGVALHALTPPGRSLSKGMLGKRLAAFRLRRLHDRLAAQLASLNPVGRLSTRTAAALLIGGIIVEVAMHLFTRIA